MTKWTEERLNKFISEEESLRKHLAIIGNKWNQLKTHEEDLVFKPDISYDENLELDFADTTIFINEGCDSDYECSYRADDIPFEWVYDDEALNKAIKDVYIKRQEALNKAARDKEEAKKRYEVAKYNRYLELKKEFEG